MSPDPVVYFKKEKEEGKFLSNVDLHLVFWGKRWQDVKLAKLADRIRSNVEFICKSGYLSGLEQYNKRERITVKLTSKTAHTGGFEPPPEFEFSDPANPAAPTRRSNVVEEITSRISAGPPFAPNAPDQIYVVFMPPGATCKDENCDGEACVGQHFYFQHTRGKVYYAWVLYGSGSPERLTTLFSEELVEAITDPEPGTGWGMVDNGKVRREIADVCELLVENIGPDASGSPVYVQTYYSNADEDAIAPR